MRWSVLLLALILVNGCEVKPSTKSADAGAPPATAADKQTMTAVVKAPEEPEVDKGPPQFDPGNAKRTLRWINSLVQQSRQPVANRSKASEQLKSAQTALSECLKKTVRWKIPFKEITVDGLLMLAPIPLTAGNGSDKQPQTTISVRPWNSIRNDSLFLCPSYPWLSGLRGGQDAVIVQGLVVGVTAHENDWFVSLSEIRFAPASDTDASVSTEPVLSDKIDPDDVDKTFAFLRRRIFKSFDPFVASGDREHLKKLLNTDLRGLSGTKVRWRWPTEVLGESAIAVQDYMTVDYEYQANVAVGLLLKQPKASDKTGQLIAAVHGEYGKALLGAPGSKMINPEVTAKIRESKKATISGKIAKITTVDDRTFPPRAMQIAVWLDDVGVEP
jgi:hypothetical protein